MNTIKEELVKELKSNEHIVQIIPLDDLLKKYRVRSIATQKRLKDESRPDTPGNDFIPSWKDVHNVSRHVANYTSPIKDSNLARQLIREFGLAGKVIIKRWGGKSYVIFKGSAATRTIFRGTRYSVANPKVIKMAVGPKGIVKSVKGGFILTVVLCTAVNVFDYFIRDTATLSQLLGQTTSDFIKIGVSSIAAVTAGLIVGSLTVLSSPAIPLIATIIVAVYVSGKLDKTDEKYGVTQALIQAYEDAGISLNQTIQDVKSIPKTITKEIDRWEKGLINKALHPWSSY